MPPCAAALLVLEAVVAVTVTVFVARFVTVEAMIVSCSSSMAGDLGLRDRCHDMRNIREGVDGHHKGVRLRSDDRR